MMPAAGLSCGAVRARAIPAIATTPAAAAVPSDPDSAEVLVEAAEPKYVAPTLRDRIGRIWAPVLINGKGPFRLVLDTGASHSAIISRVARSRTLSAAQSAGFNWPRNMQVNIIR